jgi:hypothetical protein
MLPLSVTAGSEPPGRLHLRQAPTPNRDCVSILVTGCDWIFHRFRGFPSRRFRLAGPGPWHRPLTCFRFAPSCEVDGILRFGCYPCLVQAESEPPGRLPPAPGSCPYRRVGCDFLQPSLFSIGRFHLAGPVDHSRPFTCFRFAPPCEAGDISQVWMLPLNRFGRIRAPWPPSSCARLLHPSSYPVAGMTSDQLGSARFSTAFAACPSRRFHLTVPIR